MTNIDNIVIINDFAEVIGGAAKVAIDSARGMADAGYHVTFIYGTGQACEKLKHPNIVIFSLEQYTILDNPNYFKSALSGIWNWSVFYKLKKILSSLDNTRSIIHIHSWVKSLSVSAISAVVRSGVPNVVTIHDYFTVCPNGGFFNYSENKVCGLKPMSISCITSNCDSRNYAYKSWRLVRQLFYKPAGMPNKIRNFIFVSDFSKNVVSKYLPISANSWDISNPIAINRLMPACPSSSKYYTFVGRLSAEKGVLLLPLLKKLPPSRLRFIGAGNLETILKKQLPEAEFLGWLPENQVLKYLYEARALLFLSDCYETQGLVVLEAAALGIPAIISSDTSATDYVDDYKTGLIFEKGSVASLEDKILLLEDDRYVDYLGKAAYNRYWESSCSISQHVDLLLNCYKKILSSN